jgi:protein TonB
MFEETMLSGGPLSTRLLSTCAGLTGQAIVVGTMLLVPLVFPSTLPQLRSYIALTAPGPPPPPPPPPPMGQTMARPRAVIRQLNQNVLTLPVRVPDRAAIIEDPPDLPLGEGVRGGVPGGVVGGSTTGIVGGVLDQAPAVAPPPQRVVERIAQPAQVAPAPVIRVRVGGEVRLGSPIHRVEPVYPPLARTARIEGVVELEGVVGVDGRIRELKVKTGHPFLARAAVDAVRQWIYTPTTLNGVAVEVISPIVVTFRLGR